MKVYVEFLGIPKIYVNNIWRKINKNKINSIVLYILYNEECTRDELSAMFWPDSNEKRAKSNLRNALYQIRKKFGKDFLDTEGHSFVSIGEIVDLSKDIDVFLDPDNGEKLLKLRESVFMDKIYLRDNDVFNDWVLGVRRAYENILLTTLNTELDNQTMANNLDIAERVINKIIEVDPYNEKAYREKIKINMGNHDFNEGIKQYKEIESKVKNDLDVELEDETKELYKFMVNNKNKIGDQDRKDYFERADISLLIRNEYEKFMKGDNFKNIIVQGEIGIGKSRLIDNFLRSVNCNNYTLELNQTINEVDGLGYRKLLQIFNVKNSESLEDSYRELSEKILENKKIILYIKNLEFIDKKSFDLLSEIILDNNKNNIFVISEFSISLSNNFEINKRLSYLKNTININVPLLSKHETIDYIRFKYPNYKSNNLKYSDIYESTLGNTMFINEYITGEKNDSGIIGILINSFSTEEYDVINKISIFEEYFTIDLLQQIVDVKKLDLLNIIERLWTKRLLIENGKGMKIKYSSLKSRIYHNIPHINRIEYHRVLAEYLEKKNKKDFDSYNFLSYHFGKAENYYKKYYYQIKLLEVRLDYYDQLFPTLTNIKDKPKELYTNREYYYEEFNELYTNIQDMRLTIDGKKYYELILLLEFLVGRTMIGGGRKEQGILHIDTVIEMSKSGKNEKFLLKGYIEYIHYGIHKNDMDIMGKYIKLSKNILDKEKYYLEYGELTRLEGLYELKKDNLKEAEFLLKKSLDIYNVPELLNRNMFPIIAGNNYLGNLYTKKEKYKEAENYYLEAIGICFQYGIRKTLDIVYADYGYMLFIKGDYNKSEQILNKAVNIYDALGTHWKRTVVESLLGEIAYMNGDYDKAIGHLRSAEIFVKKDQKPDEMIILNDLKKKITKIN